MPLAATPLLPPVQTSNADDLDPRTILALAWLLETKALRISDGRLLLAPQYWPGHRHLAGPFAYTGGKTRSPINGHLNRIHKNFCNRLHHEHPETHTIRCAMTIQALIWLEQGGYEFEVAA